MCKRKGEIKARSYAMALSCVCWAAICVSSHAWKHVTDRWSRWPGRRQPWAPPKARIELRLLVLYIAYLMLAPRARLITLKARHVAWALLLLLQFVRYIATTNWRILSTWTRSMCSVWLVN